MLKKIMLLLAVISAVALFADETATTTDVEISNWQFKWTVISVEDFAIEITKSDYQIYSEIRRGKFDNVKLTSEEAKLVGEFFKSIEAQFAKMKEEGKTEIIVNINDEIKVRCGQNDLDGRTVNISKGRGVFNDVDIPYTHIANVTKVLGKLSTYIEYVRENVNPNK